MIAQARLGPGPHPPLHARDRRRRARARGDVRARRLARHVRPAARDARQRPGLDRRVAHRNRDGAAAHAEGGLADGHGRQPPRAHRDLRDQGGRAERRAEGPRPRDPGPRRRRRLATTSGSPPPTRTCARCASPTAPTRCTSSRSPGASSRHTSRARGSAATDSGARTAARATVPTVPGNSEAQAGVQIAHGRVAAVHQGRCWSPRALLCRCAPLPRRRPSESPKRNSKRAPVSSPRAPTRALTRSFFTQAAGHPPWGITAFEVNHVRCCSDRNRRSAQADSRRRPRRAWRPNPEALPKCPWPSSSTTNAAADTRGGQQRTHGLRRRRRRDAATGAGLQPRTAAWPSPRTSASTSKCRSLANEAHLPRRPRRLGRRFPRVLRNQQHPQKANCWA